MSEEKNLHITIIQPNLFEDKHKNFDNIRNLIARAKKTDIILLPEMFNTSFVPEKHLYAEKMTGETIKWMNKISLEFNCAVVGTLMINENKKIYNRLIWISSSQKVFYYDKRHLFKLANEDKFLARGHKKKLIIQHDDWKICPLICYDLRFPVFSRNDEDYDVLIYLANWPKSRIVDWEILLNARAIENQCYTFGVNRIGKDSKKNYYNGHSQFIDPFNNKITSCKKGKQDLLQVNINKNALKKARAKMRFLSDRDQFILQTN